VRSGRPCAHLVALGFIEAGHPPHHETRPAVASEALPPEPDHTHDDFDRAVRIGGSAVTVTSTSRVSSSTIIAWESLAAVAST